MWLVLARHARRTITFGFALRLGIGVFGALALWLAIPDLEYWLLYPVAIVPLPLLAAIRPKSLFPVATFMFSVVLLLISGYLVDDMSPYLAIAIGVCGYIQYACATMSAVWRVDTATQPRVWRSWLTRVGAVVLLTGALAVVVAAVSEEPMPGPPALLGAAAAVLVLVLISAVAWLYHRGEA